MCLRTTCPPEGGLDSIPPSEFSVRFYRGEKRVPKNESTRRYFQLSSGRLTTIGSEVLRMTIQRNGFSAD
jgi:hypothetical protein